MRVVLVDDVTAIRALVRIYLMEFKFAFEEAKNGAEALAFARATPPALIITDLQMPVMDGLVLLQNIRADPQLARVPVIVLSADQQQTANLQHLNPALTFIALKPIDPAALKSVVRKALET